MPAVLWVLLVLVVLVGTLLAVDWVTAGRMKRRTFRRARDGSQTDNAVNYTHHEQTVNNMQHWSNP